jgi:hypothetical protein
MKTMLPPVSIPIRKATLPIPTQVGSTDSLPAAQGSLHFGADAFHVSKLIKAGELKNPEIVLPKDEAEKRFKEICDQVVWEGGKDLKVNVAEMLAYLCRVRPKEKYPGYGTVETLAKDFPGLNTNLLKKSFDQLHSSYHLDRYYVDYSYRLRMRGLRMLEKFYPEVILPPKEERYISRWAHPGIIDR